MRRAAAALLAVAALLAPVVASGPVAATSALPTFAANDRREVGMSVDGRAIIARHYGALDAPVQLVVIGQMHGSEPGGLEVARVLANRRVPDGVGLWVIPSMNPDGGARGTRTNARGVDLNRNFPRSWRGGARGTYYPGPRAASEPETRAMMAFLQEVRPTAVLSFHQAFDAVDTSNPRSAQAARLLARWMGEDARRIHCAGPCHGTMTQWIDAELGAIAITVELDGRVSHREAERAAAAVLRLGAWLGR